MIYVIRLFPLNAHNICVNGLTSASCHVFRVTSVSCVCMCVCSTILHFMSHKLTRIQINCRHYVPFVFLRVPFSYLGRFEKDHPIHSLETLYQWLSERRRVSCNFRRDLGAGRCRLLLSLKITRCFVLFHWDSI